MVQVTVHEAKTNLSKLIRIAQEGREVIIARGKKPVVKLTRIDEVKPTRTIGSARGKVTILPGFDEPLDDFKDYTG